MNGYEFADADIFMDNDTGEWTASWSGGRLEGDDLHDVTNQLQERGWEIVELNGGELPLTFNSWQTASATIAYHALIRRLRNERRAR